MPRLGIGLGIGERRGRARVAATPGVLFASASYISVTGQDSVLRIARILAGAQASIAVSGQAANLSLSSLSIVADTAFFTVTGEVMTPIADYAIPAVQALIAVSGQTAGVIAAKLLAAAQGSVAVSGQAATLTKSSNYTGPGDIVSGATTWASSARAYSAAFAATGGAIMDLVDQLGANPITINILSTGFADLAAISAWVTAHSVTTIKVAKLYDQTGNGLHWTQTTLANMPTLTLSAINGLPGVTFASASAQRLDTPQTLTMPSSSGPMTFSAVAKRTANFTTKQSIIGSQPGQQIGIGFTTSANTIGLVYIGTVPTLGSVPDSSFHAIQGVVNSTSSVISADGVSNTGTASGSSPGANQGFRFGRDQGGNNPFDGIGTEVGVWLSTAFTTQNISDVTSNQRDPSKGYNF